MSDMIDFGDSSIVEADVILEKPNLDSFIKRPNTLSGITHRVESPLSSHSIYVTVNDIVVEGKRYPYEIFINSKTAEHQQWVTALTLLISFILKNSVSVKLDVESILSSLSSVTDPLGGYIKKGKKIPSLVSEIADLVMLSVSGHVAVKKGTTTSVCPECNKETLVHSEGCVTCACGYSRC